MSVVASFRSCCQKFFRAFFLFSVQLLFQMEWEVPFALVENQYPELEIVEAPGHGVPSRFGDRQ